MNIAVIADPELPVPPALYGGIERIIDILINGLLQQNHSVTLFAHKNSTSAAKLIPYMGENSTDALAILKNTWLINTKILQGNYDIIHSFGRLIYLIPQLPLNVRKVMTYQREPTVTQIKKAMLLSKEGTLTFTGCSDYITNQISSHAPAHTIYNSVNINAYEFSNAVNSDSPLVFLGRIEPLKGTHIAIEVAKRTSKKLIIAGNIAPEFETYFDQNIKPNLDDQIKYVGPVNDMQKSNLLSNAAALLMPIEWDEPFGIVMIEAMACGTPVIAFKRGAVEEIIREGVNGFSCNSVVQMVSCVNNVKNINRELVRQDVERRFSSAIIIENYLDLYKRLLKGLQ